MALINGTPRNDRLNGTSLNDIINGLGGNDIIQGLAGADIINGGDGNDIIFGGDGNDIALNGDAGNDIIYGGAGDDGNMNGGDGNDTMYGGLGQDDLFGDGGNDLLYGEDGNDYLNGLDGDDILYGGAGDDILEGGGSGNDFLSGGAGDDELVGYDGADRLRGDSGNDKFKFFLGSFEPSSPLATVDVVLDFERAGVLGGDQIELLNSGYLSFNGKISVNPVSGAILSGAGNGLNDVFYTVKSGNAWLLVDKNDNGILDVTDTAIQFNGVRAFTQADFTDKTNFVVAGTNNADSLVGTEFDDVIFGLGGNDSILGLGGNDLIFGGAGDDTLDGGIGFDELHGEAGNDTITLKGSDIGGNAYGGEGNDVLFGSDVEFTFSLLDGGAGDDTLQAGTAGASLADFDGGNDRLVGGVGDDQFFGGAGNDLFVFGAIWTSPSGFQDVIYDFEDGLDKIDLRGSGLTFTDLAIDDSGYSAIITSTAGQIEVTLVGQPSSGAITQADFLFA